jgi:hypothetical protein
VENARLTVNGADLEVAVSKSYAMYFRDRALEEAVRDVFGRPLRIKVAAGETAGSAGAPLAGPKGALRVEDDDATTRALANPEVQRFREVFGGSEIRKVRNLKE